jgi:threonyl-tRNA synthetase
MIKDAIGRQWQLGTIQVDYNLPERFQLEYIGQDNEKHRPVMIHRAPFGSFERFIAILTEHCAGNFPLWLAPKQIAILPISDKFLDYAENISKQLADLNFRTQLDSRAEKIGKKIRDAEMMKIPYMLVIGEKELESNQLSVRKHGKGDLGAYTIADFSKILQEELNN